MSRPDGPYNSKRGIEKNETGADPMLGLIVQKMPGVENDALVDRFWNNVVESSYWEGLVNGEEVLDANKFVELVSSKFEVKLKRFPLDFYCRCDEKSFGKILKSSWGQLEQEKGSLGEKKGGSQSSDDKTKVNCHYCNKLYVFDNDGIKN